MCITIDTLESNRPVTGEWLSNFTKLHGNQEIYTETSEKSAIKRSSQMHLLCQYNGKYM